MKEILELLQQLMKKKCDAKVDVDVSAIASLSLDALLASEQWGLVYRVAALHLENSWEKNFIEFVIAKLNDLDENNEQLKIRFEHLQEDIMNNESGLVKHMNQAIGAKISASVKAAISIDSMQTAIAEVFGT